MNFILILFIYSPVRILLESNTTNISITVFNYDEG